MQLNLLKVNYHFVTF